MNIKPKDHFYRDDYSVAIADIKQVIDAESGEEYYKVDTVIYVDDFIYCYHTFSTYGAPTRKQLKDYIDKVVPAILRTTLIEVVMRGNTLSDIVNPWVKALPLPNGWTIQPWSNSQVGIVRGHTHWYVHFPLPDARVERWFMTVRGDHVEVRDPNDDGPKVIATHQLSAADPEFFTKLESDIRAALDHLAHS